jgi:hypothetical protein
MGFAMSCFFPRPFAPLSPSTTSEAQKERQRRLCLSMVDISLSVKLPCYKVATIYPAD